MDYKKYLVVLVFVVPVATLADSNQNDNSFTSKVNRMMNKADAYAHTFIEKVVPACYIPILAADIALCLSAEFRGFIFGTNDAFIDLSPYAQGVSATNDIIIKEQNSFWKLFGVPLFSNHNTLFVNSSKHMDSKQIVESLALIENEFDKKIITACAIVPVISYGFLKILEKCNSLPQFAHYPKTQKVIDSCTQSVRKSTVITSALILAAYSAYLRWTSSNV